MARGSETRRCCVTAKRQLSWTTDDVAPCAQMKVSKGSWRPTISGKRKSDYTTATRQAVRDEAVHSNNQRSIITTYSCY
jgi:hypothetical protein